MRPSSTHRLPPTQPPPRLRQPANFHASAHYLERIRDRLRHGARKCANTEIGQGRRARAAAKWGRAWRAGLGLSGVPVLGVDGTRCVQEEWTGGIDGRDAVDGVECHAHAQQLERIGEDGDGAW
ncbi:hypothetical protein EI94DRAFT_1792054 [Lactarius quietus]|nr:hypothetical protein EI94DRAFT_1792054 [Lactarius quietus]